MSEESDTSTIRKVVDATAMGIGTILLAYIIGLFALYTIGQFISFESPKPFISAVLFAVEFGIIGIAVFLVSYLIGVHNYVSFSVPSKDQWSKTGLTIFIMLVVQFISSIFLIVFNIESATNSVVDMGQDSPVFYLYMIPVMILFVGPIEEYMFRGVIQKVYTRKFNRNVGIGVASILFGLIHISAIGGLSLESIPYILTASTLGVVLGYYYDETDNLAVPMLAHGVYNSVLMLVSFGFVA